MEQIQEKMLSYKFWTILYLARASTGHSWVEDVRALTEDGNITGDPGFARGNGKMI